MSNNSQILGGMPAHTRFFTAFRQAMARGARVLRQACGRATATDIAASLTERGISHAGVGRPHTDGGVEIQITRDVFVRVEARSMHVVAWIEDMPQPYTTRSHAMINAIVGDIHQARSFVAEYYLQCVKEGADGRWTANIAHELMAKLAPYDVPDLSIGMHNDGTRRSYIRVGSNRPLHVEILACDHFQVAVESESGMQLQFPIRDSMDSLVKDICHASTYVFPQSLSS